MIRFLERFAPWIAGVFAALVYWGGCCFYRIPVYVPSKVENLFNAGINVAGVMIAFIGTLQGILISLDKNPIVNRLKELDVYDQLIEYFSSAVRLGFLLLGISGIGLFSDFSNPATWQRVFFVVWAGTCVLAATGAYRIIYLFGEIIKK